MANDDDSPVIRDLRKQLKAKDDRISELITRDRSRVLNDLGVPEQARQSVMMLLGSEDSHWESPDSLREAISGIGLDGLLGNQGNAQGQQQQGQQAPPQSAEQPTGLTDAERRAQAIAASAAPPPSGKPPSLLEQAEEARQAGDVKKSLALKAAHMLQQRPE